MFFPFNNGEEENRLIGTTLIFSTRVEETLAIE
jgi:hypothetical protein